LSAAFAWDRATSSFFFWSCAALYSRWNAVESGRSFLLANRFDRPEIDGEKEHPGGGCARSFFFFSLIASAFWYISTLLDDENFCLVADRLCSIRILVDAPAAGARGSESPATLAAEES
jgi:hypothetical protein